MAARAVRADLDNESNKSLSDRLMNYVSGALITDQKNHMKSGIQEGWSS